MIHIAEVGITERRHDSKSIRNSVPSYFGAQRHPAGFSQSEESRAVEVVVSASATSKYTRVLIQPI